MIVFSTLDRWTSLWQHIAKPPSKGIFELYSFFIWIVYSIFVYMITVYVRIPFLGAQFRRLDSVLSLHYEQSLFPLFRSEIVKHKEHANECENRLPRENTRRAFLRSRRLRTRGWFSRSLPCSFSSTTPERRERLLVVYIISRLPLNE